jgi:HAD superfamily phosphoserine phosphatase-like hydrolase
MAEIKLVVFDVDGTLNDIDKSPWRSITKELGASTKQHVEIYDNFKMGRCTKEEAIQGIVNLWTETGNAHKTKFMQIFQNIPLKDGVEEVIAYLRQKYKIFLISGTLDLYMDLLKAKIGVQDGFCFTKLYWDEKGFIKWFDYDGINPEKKLEVLNDYLAKNRFNFDEVAVVGDGDNDHLLFEKAKMQFLIVGEYSNRPENKGYLKISNLLELKGYL